MTSTYVPMADAAYAANIPPGFPIAAGYYGGPLAYHTWPEADWDRFPGYKLPIWVNGNDGGVEGAAAVAALRALGVPQGSITVADLEARKGLATDADVVMFGGELHAAGYLVWTYGSRSTVFSLPRLDGYWVAEYGLTMAQVMAGLASDTVRAWQYAANLPPGYDASLVKGWAEGEMWHGGA